MLVSVALFRALYLAAFNVRPLAVILLYAARTFLPLLLSGDCLASFGVILTQKEKGFGATLVSWVQKK